MDCFRGKMMDSVLLKLRENSIFLVRVPPRMNNLFQPLDLTVNGAAKAFKRGNMSSGTVGKFQKL